MTAARGSRALQLIRLVVALDILMLPLAIWAQFVTTKYQSQYGSDVSGALLVVGILVQVGVAGLVGLRRPENPVGWLLLASVTANLLDSGVLQPYTVYAVNVTHHGLPAGDLVGSLDQMMWVPYVVPLAILLPLVFPTGRLLSPRWRPVLWVALGAMVVTFVGGDFGSRGDKSNLIHGVNPILLPDPLPSIAGFMKSAIVLLPPCIVAAVASLVLRYRRGSADERHQVKWLIASVALYLVGFVAGLIPTLLGHPIRWVEDVAVVGLALIPVAAAVAVLKYRLYDIDVVISRALVYGALAAFITAVYVGIVVGLGTVVGGGGRPNLALSIVATAVVAVAFQPVRDRFQHLANRLVYGKRATPYEVLSHFSEQVSESYANNDVLRRMAQVMAEGVGATRADVWLRNGSVLSCVGSWPRNGAARPPRPTAGDRLVAQGDDERVVEVRHHGDLLGALGVTKRSGEALTPIEEKLLDDLAHQAGLVLKNVGLTADLQARLDELRASRQRLVAAQDEERRRLERNLHDGAQQHLVALKVKLGLAEMLLDRDPERAEATIQQLKGDADEALETLRDLARGIYPPLLADRGLAAALEAQARKATVPVEVVAEGLGRYAQEVEAAVYFCVLEALQNVQKYAGATSVVVRLREVDGNLTFQVGDNGRGFDVGATRRGSGLTNMSDRMDALGGTLEIDSRPAMGSDVRGNIPVMAEALVS